MRNSKPLDHCRCCCSCPEAPAAFVGVKRLLLNRECVCLSGDTAAG